MSTVTQAEDRGDAWEPPSDRWLLRIDGRSVASRSGDYYRTFDPATGAEAATVADAGAGDVGAAFESGDRAAHEWRSSSLEERAEVIREWAGRIEQHGEELARLDSYDSGNPLSAMRADVRLATRMLHVQAGLALGMRGEVIANGSRSLHYTLRQPFGVVGRIVAYNHPLLYATTRVAPAILAGNAVILKPAPQTPLTSLRFAELVDDLTPRGLFNVLTGRGAELGQSLVEHRQIRRLSFIGSVVVGRKIQAAAAASGVKTVTLELGGKNPLIVLPDADIGAAADAAFRGMNLTSVQGQSCGSTSRILVHGSVAHDFREALVRRLESVRLGHPFDPSADMGPLISHEHRESVRRALATAQAEGAVMSWQGTGPVKGEGYFEPPALLESVRPDMAIARTEIFGPVLSMTTFSTEAEALQIANGLDYALAASVWTEDLRTAHRLARDIEAGYVWVNDVAEHYPGLPFGGWKDSGVGREESADEIISYTQEKAVSVRLE